jgi:hypothetical protein
MVDGEFFAENWKENLAFALGTRGSLIVRYTSDEVDVAAIALCGFPATEPRPLNDTLITALKSIIASEDKVAALLNTYHIAPSTPQEEVASALNSLLGDMR